MPAKRRHDGARLRIPTRRRRRPRPPSRRAPRDRDSNLSARPFPTACSSHTASDNTASSCASITRSGRISRAAGEEARRRLSSSTGTIHARSVQSRDAVTTVVSRSTATRVSARTCHTTSTCPRSVARCAPVATSHILTSASVDADATIGFDVDLGFGGFGARPTRPERTRRETLPRRRRPRRPRRTRAPVSRSAKDDHRRVTKDAA